MAYLNEDGLETLVGKIKGQAIELTSAEYRQLPATKNTDNKLYFVTDEAYAYQIDDEPTSGSSGLVKSGGVYNWTSKIGSGTLTTTAQTIIPAVNELNAKIGSTDISSIGDGTLSGAVSELNTGLTNLQWQEITGYGSYRVGINFVDIHIATNSSVTINAYSRTQIATISGAIVDFSRITGLVLARNGNNAFPLGIELSNSGVLSLYNTSSASVTLSEIVGDIRLPIHS